MRHARIDAATRIIKLEVRTLSRTIAVTSAAVVLSGWVRESAVAWSGPTTAFEFFRLYDVERSLSNWLQPILLILAAALLATIAGLSKQDGDLYWRRWAALACLFAFMSVDETTNLDAAGLMTSPLFGKSNAVTMMGPIIVTAALLGAYFSPLLFMVPRRFAYTFAVSGLLLVGGAIGLDVISQVIAGEYGVGSSPYIILASLEETFETAGSALFCITLLHYLRARCTDLNVNFGTSP